MLREDDEWPEWVKMLVYKEDGLTSVEQRVLKGELDDGALRLAHALRFGPDPFRTDSMSTRELVRELRDPRYG